jgi:hypothetical protein
MTMSISVLVVNQEFEEAILGYCDHVERARVAENAPCKDICEIVGRGGHGGSIDPVGSTSGSAVMFVTLLSEGRRRNRRTQTPEPTRYQTAVVACTKFRQPHDPESQIPPMYERINERPVVSKK